MAEWAGLGYYARARNLLKCARVVASELGGTFPDTEEGLRALPGIGPYTAAAIASIAFDRPAPVLDGNIERVLSRLFAVTEPLPASKPQLKELAARLTPCSRPGLPRAGADGPRRHDLHAEIARLRYLPADAGLRGAAPGDRGEAARQDPEETQAGAPRASPISCGGRMVRSSWRRDRPPACWAECWAGPEATGWRAHPEPDPPVEARWHDPGLEVRHTFTHFHLRLSLKLARVDRDDRALAWGLHRPARVPPHRPCRRSCARRSTCRATAGTRSRPETDAAAGKPGD
jgi:A/G-specific adenine glycosylase